MVVSSWLHPTASKNLVPFVCLCNLDMMNHTNGDYGAHIQTVSSSYVKDEETA